MVKKQAVALEVQKEQERFDKVREKQTQVMEWECKVQKVQKCRKQKQIEVAEWKILRGKKKKISIYNLKLINNSDVKLKH